MGNPSARHIEDVTVLHGGLLAPGGAQQLAAASLAEMTHLPTGVASGRSETISILAGRERAEPACDLAPLLLYVVEGQVAVAWNEESPRSVTASAGDTVLVPAGIAIRTCNTSPETTSRLILVRG